MLLTRTVLCLMRKASVSVFVAGRMVDASQKLKLRMRAIRMQMFGWSSDDSGKVRSWHKVFVCNALTAGSSTTRRPIVNVVYESD